MFGPPVHIPIKDEAQYVIITLCVLYVVCCAIVSLRVAGRVLGVGFGADDAFAILAVVRLLQ